MRRPLAIALSVSAILFACGPNGHETYTSHRTPPPSTGGDDANPNGPTPTPTPTIGPIGDQTVSDALAAVSEARLREGLMYLAGPTLQGRKTGTDGSRLAREYVSAEMAKAGVLPGASGQWFQSFSIRSSRGERLAANNVIGVLKGNDAVRSKEVIVVGAHYDHLGASTSGLMYPGADDNASGTDALIEVARAMAAVKKSIRRTIVFAAFDAEEKGLLGSEYYVANPVYPMKSTVYMINMDMIGYLDQKKNILALGALGSPSAATMLQEIAPRYPGIGTPSLTQAGGGGSDHAPFGAAGVPYVFFHTGTDVSPYHQPEDTPDKIDYPGVTTVTRVVIEMLWKIAQADKAPVVGDLSGARDAAIEAFADHDVASPVH